MPRLLRLVLTLWVLPALLVAGLAVATATSAGAHEEVHTGSPREAFCPNSTATSRPPG